MSTIKIQIQKVKFDSWKPKDTKFRFNILGTAEE